MIMPRFMSKCKEENKAASLSECAFYFTEQTFLYNKSPDTASLLYLDFYKIYMLSVLPMLLSYDCLNLSFTHFGYIHDLP